MVERVVWDPSDDEREAACEWMRSQGVDPRRVSMSLLPELWRHKDGSLRLTYAKVLGEDLMRPFVCCGVGEQHVAAQLVTDAVDSVPPGVEL